MSRAKQKSSAGRVVLVLLCMAFNAPVFAGAVPCDVTCDDERSRATDVVVPQDVEEIVRAAPASLSYGADGIDFIAVDGLRRVQAEYRGEGWCDDWYVVARRTIHGDPIFVDTSKPGLPVMTASHGMGGWTPEVVAPAWHDFVGAVERVRAFSIGREHPVALEENPPADAERQTLQDDLVHILGTPLPAMWEIMTMPIDD